MKVFRYFSLLRKAFCPTKKNTRRGKTICNSIRNTRRYFGLKRRLRIREQNKMYCRTREKTRVPFSVCIADYSVHLIHADCPPGTTNNTKKKQR